MKHGVPRLLDCLARHHLIGTFFLTMGPDYMGRALLQLRRPRFLLKMLSTNAPSLYGWRTIFSGTLLPAKPIATAFPDIVRRIERDGHEAAVHAWDHRRWQDELPTFSSERIYKHFARSVAAFRSLTGHDPAGIGAAAWMTTATSLAIQDQFPFTYASDLRASPPCRLVTEHGLRRLPQLPGSGLCLEEHIGRGVTGTAALADALLNDLRNTPGPLRVLTLHAEVEGGPFLDVLELLAPQLHEFGENVPMQVAAERLAPTLRERRYCMRTLPGRAFRVSSSRALIP